MKAKTLILVPAIGLLTGCAGIASMNHDFVMGGSEAGIRAYNDGVIGNARTAKEAFDKENEYLQYRKNQEIEVTIRDTKPGFFSGLFSQPKTKGDK